jgi:hypothetical protein
MRGRAIVAEKEGKTSTSTSIFWALVLWAGACVLAAFKIPQYDMGFDGIKIYLVLCAFMLVVVLSVRTFLFHAKFIP